MSTYYAKPASILWRRVSARYLFEKGKEEQSRKVLGRLHGCHMEDGQLVLSDAAEQEFQAMRAGMSPVNIQTWTS